MKKAIVSSLALFAAACGEDPAGAPDPAPPVALHEFRATATGFQQRVAGGGWEPFLPVGINFGLAVPATYPGEFAASREEIASWIEATADLGANVIRLYTVQSPAFYEELRRWNLAHPDRPLFLLQGAWLIEPEVQPVDYLADDVQVWFRGEIERVVDVVHGNREIPEAVENRGRATGRFTADVSPWLLGWLIGREVEPYSLQSTYELHPDARSYHGQYFTVEDADPIEPFVASSFDYLATFERERYGSFHPVGFSNWPTLDPLTHETEPPMPVSSEDSFALDVKQIAVDPAFDAGLFVSYHAYPYYPDFVLFQPEYHVSDEDGLNSYLGYLRDLRSYYEGYTLIVGEIGIPSSQGSAHRTPSGLDHGGMDEAASGRAMSRSIRTILDAGLDGFALFSIVDEWWKRAWIVDPIELPAERRALWFNPMSPEQNFGLIALRPGPADRFHFVDGEDDEWLASPLLTGDDRPAVALSDGADGARTLRDLAVEHDEGWLHLRLRVDGPVDWEKVDYLIAFDTIDPQRGEGFLDETKRIAAGRRVEFLLRIASPNDVTLSVIPPYDLYGVWHGLREPWQHHRSEAVDEGRFDPMRNLVNWEYVWNGEQLGPFVDDPIGTLPTGHEAEVSTSNFWFADGVMEIRIPWSLLQVSDPSSLQVIDGDAATGRGLATSTTEGIAVAAVALGPDGSLADSLPAAVPNGDGWSLPAEGFGVYRWEGWNRVRYHAERKASFGILQEALPSLRGHWHEAR